MKFLLVVLLGVCLTTSMDAQTKLTFTPSIAQKLPFAVWGVTACVPTALSGGVIVRAGDIQSKLTQHHIEYLLPSQAAAALNAAPSKSIPARLVKYAGYLSAAAAFLLTTDIVKASMPWTAGLTTASGALNVVVPLATKAVPLVSTDIQSALLGPFLVVPIGQCSTAYILGQPGLPFEETLP